MVRSCSAYNCTNKFDKNRPDIYFHRFPFSRPEVFKKWILAVRRRDWLPSKSSDICSEHFVSTDYEEDLPGNKRKRLKLDAVPSKFDFSLRLNKPVKKRRILESSNLQPDEEEKEESVSVENCVDCSVQSSSGCQPSVSKKKTSPLKIKLGKES